MLNGVLFRAGQLLTSNGIATCNYNIIPKTLAGITLPQTQDSTPTTQYAASNGADTSNSLINTNHT